MILAFSSQDRHLTSVNWTSRREFAAIEMKRVDAKHSGVEFGIRL